MRLQGICWGLLGMSYLAGVAFERRTVRLFVLGIAVLFEIVTAAGLGVAFGPGIVTGFEFVVMNLRVG